MKPKVLSLYQAVLSLLDEGVDMNTMTVSSVAERAGIGKGTVYDYFSSKEDLVVSAILYGISQMNEQLEEIIRQEDSFERKIYGIFDAIKPYMSAKRGFSRLIRLVNYTFEMGRPLCQELHRRREEVQGPKRALTELYQVMIEEGLSDGKLPASAAAMTLATKFLMYMMYLGNQENETEISEEKMKWFLYQSILADLNLQMV